MTVRETRAQALVVTHSIHSVPGLQPKDHQARDVQDFLRFACRLFNRVALNSPQVWVSLVVFGQEVRIGNWQGGDGISDHTFVDGVEAETPVEKV